MQKTPHNLQILRKILKTKKYSKLNPILRGGSEVKIQKIGSFST